MRIGSFGVFLLAPLAGACGEAPVAPENAGARPNIVWIIADDLSLEVVETP